MYAYIHRTFLRIVKNLKLAEYQLIAELINIFQYSRNVVPHETNKQTKKLENEPTHLGHKFN